MIKLDIEKPQSDMLVLSEAAGEARVSQRSEGVVEA